MTALAARGIGKSFGRRRVLAGLNLDVAEGELVAVAGENGTGKTTLLRILAGDLRPDTGTVAVAGRLGYCPQTVVVDEALTVGQHVRYFQAAYGIGSLARADELTERLGLAGCGRQRACHMSGGTRQKLSLLLALIHQPAVLLLDEPYQGFDWQTYLAFWDLAGELAAAGTAVVIISHLVFEQERFDRICHLADGRIREEAAVRRSRPFDRRLVLAGYRYSALITAKTTAGVLQAVGIGGYAAVVLLVFWRPAGIGAVAAAFILGAATYAAFGLLVGVLVRGDQGFFLIIMISMLDTFLENPVDNPLANKPLLEFFPSYAPTQFAAAGAFHHQLLVSMAVLSVAWTAAFALLGLAVLRLRLPRTHLVLSALRQARFA